jgi:2,3-bisphosphoglycerate-independent phosphoglycerate mutase
MLQKLYSCAVNTSSQKRFHMPSSILYVVLDGVGDLPNPDYQNRTPLELASTPNLDKLAKEGMMGSAYSVKRGIAPESDAGVFSLLSYDPSKLDLSRGVVEALGSGMNFRDGDLALRCNFATVQDGQITDRRAGRNVSTEEAEELANAINNSAELKKLANFELRATIGHRCALVLRAAGTRFSGSISNLDPAYSRVGKVTIAKAGVKLPAPIPNCVPLTKTKAAGKTAELLNKFAEQIHLVLKDHPVNVHRKQRGDLPANYLLMRDAGTRRPKVKTLQQKFKLTAIALADMPVELGIAKVVGMDTERLPPDRSLAAYSQRARKAIKLLGQYGLVYVHLKGPDEPGHDGDFEGKKKSIEDIDAGFFAELRGLDTRVVCVTADHSTPCIAKSHSDDPVPILIACRNVKPDGSMRFTEGYAKKGRIGTLKHGYEILGLLKKLSR